MIPLILGGLGLYSLATGKYKLLYNLLSSFINNGVKQQLLILLKKVGNTGGTGGTGGTRGTRGTGKSRITTTGTYYNSSNPLYKLTVDDLGLKTRDLVRAFLKKLIDTGHNVGMHGADGIWGADTQTAYEASLVPSLTTTEQPVTTTQTPSHLNFYNGFANIYNSPNYLNLYHTDFDYTGSNKAIRNLGFNNYAGLLSVARGDSQFARDLRQRFGLDVSKWDLNQVESALGVSGTYGRGRHGDYSDIMRSMAIWAGTLNGTYDAAMADRNNRLFNYMNGYFRTLNSSGTLPTTTSQLSSTTSQLSSNQWKPGMDVINGFSDFLKRLLSPYNLYTKKGGKLKSKDPVIRFKSK